MRRPVLSLRRGGRSTVGVRRQCERGHAHGAAATEEERMDINGARVMVVGGASGMARATAERLAAGGCEGGDPRPPRHRGCERSPRRSVATSSSATSPTSRDEQTVAAAIEALGGLDVGVNVAGGGIGKKTLDKHGVGARPRVVPSGRRPQPGRHVQPQPAAGRGDGEERAQRRRRARRDHQHRVDRRVRGPDRPDRLHGVEGRRGRDVADDGPRPRLVRHPRQRDRAEPVRHRPRQDGARTR